MSTFKKIAGIALSLLLTASVFASGELKRVSAVDALAEEEPVEQPTVGTTEGTEGEDTQSQEMEAYMFVHFVGAEGSANDEQIYFSVSKDGTSWQTLNQTRPVLKSNVGEKGVRDPHIIRSPQGDKFYLIATDLSIYHRHGAWGESQTKGSQSIVIWESTDLINWSAPRLRKIAREDAGCTWAPESIWDNEREAYMVFWASKTQDSWTHRIYRCYTTDFDTFTEPELYIESDVSWIDTTFIEQDGVYYRFTKNEDGSALYVFMEKSTSLSGEFELVSTYTLNGKPASEMQGYEGPTAYKLNGVNKWCLLLDNYGNSAGYKPFVTDDISTGRFVSGEDFNFGGTTFRHGTVMPITMNEYNALLQKWPLDGVKEEGELVFELNFNSEDLTATVGADATITANGGTLTYGDGVNGGKAVQLKDNKYISITGANNPLKDLESFTVSFAAKVEGKSWMFFAAPNTNKQSYLSEKYIGALYDNGNLTCERYNSDDQARPAAADGKYPTGEWVHFTLVYYSDSTVIYVNGERVAKVDSDVNLKDMLGNDPVIQLGRANWNDGEFANGWLDEFRIHNYAMSVEEVVSNYKAVMGIA